MRALLCALLLWGPAVAQAEMRTFERVEWTGIWDRGFPDDPRWHWDEIELPHNWYQHPPGLGTAWYRLRHTLEDTPIRTQSLYFPKLVVSDMTVYVNQQRIWRLSDHRAYGSSITSVLVPIPRSLLREGSNIIHLEARGNPRWYHGVSRVFVGDSLVISERATRDSMVQSQMIYVSATGFGVVGLVCLWLWLRAGRDPVLFWYGVSGLALLVLTALWFETLWREDLGYPRLALIFLRTNGYLAPILILHLRLAHRRHVWLEGALWMMLAAAVLTLGINNAWRPVAWTVWGLTFATLLALAPIPLLASARLRAKPAVRLLVLADLVAALMTFHDWATRFGWLDFDRPFFVFYVAPFLMLAAGAMILQHLVVGVDAVRQSNVNLERRVAEKAREIEANHEQLRRAQREQTLAEERRRIMADMHDGLGARLVALLSVAQSGKAKHGEISEGIAAALDELRLTVDSVQPVEGDVGVVLGNVRHRMRSVFERAGITLAWNVSALPRMDNLTPERILAIQRIFLEVFSNAIRHAEATTVSVFTMRVPGAVRIVIEDDGRGFDADGVRAGNGLANLKLRAEQAGGTLSVESTPGKGTRVTLSLPLDGEGTPEPLPNTGHKTTEYPVHGIAADPVSS